ncbi:hypothetical protein PR202_ga10267 [Eleusine coracana subsp. coracana]|uniref:Uncharacterized protein n=1 Tax=Eleusine coracana subsp. coracana TaxID=191504 RepID=A0AAV5C6B3_ELECO|nr:hypothetical protein QOZ80_1AG0027130 [Eleusine coracana subsp. coracana]GJM93685.1 hypothetical protein PR202_ga10267 [Eleusine coracana subsp. coracana]
MQMQQQGGGAVQRRGKEEEEELVLATWDCGSPLYDSFELASLHHVLESHLMVLPFPGAAVSRSRRFDHSGVVTGPDVIDHGVARVRRRKGRRRTGWKGSRAAAAVFRAVTCWKSL